MICNNEDRVKQSIDCINGMLEDAITLRLDNAGINNLYLSAISIHLRDISLSLAALADNALNKEIEKDV